MATNQERTKAICDAAINGVSTTAQQDARIVEAFGAHLNLGRNATGAEVKAAVIDFVKGVVYSHETAKAARAAAAFVDKITPT